ncbi:MAG TPA: CBS domain-containing protein, partial [Terriglobales bacterium]|nr:CBS domain-containing protein [Terriglobales bacterium]
MSQQGYTEAPPDQATAGDLLVLLGREEKLIYLQPDDSLQTAAELFKKHGISQVPVVDKGKIVGAIQEITIVHALHRGTSSPKVPLHEIMARPMPQVEVRVLLEEVYRLLLAGNSGVAVVREGRPIGLITRSDLMEYYDRVAMLKF